MLRSKLAIILYNREERDVGKSKVIKLIQIKSVFLEKVEKLMLVTPTDVAAANINRTIIHGAVSINNCKNGKKKLIIRPWRVWMALIIDEISIVLLKLLASINTQLSQAKEKSDNNIAIFRGLVIVILIDNFHNFFSVIRKPL